MRDPTPLHAEANFQVPTKMRAQKFAEFVAKCRIDVAIELQDERESVDGQSPDVDVLGEQARLRQVLDAGFDTDLCFAFAKQAIFEPHVGRHRLAVHVGEDFFDFAVASAAAAAGAGDADDVCDAAKTVFANCGNDTRAGDADAAAKDSRTHFTARHWDSRRVA